MILASSLLWLFALFIAKHFVVDFLFQTPYQYLNKGDYLHPGGILHAGLHAIASVFVLGTVFLTTSALLPAFAVIAACVFEFVIHYHIDWAKVQLNKHFKLTPTEPQYWWLLGLDQYLHYLTYVIMIAICV